jgi:cytochrome c biogenesis factor
MKSTSRPTLRHAYVGIAVVLAVAAAFALIQWVFAAQLTQVLDWQETAFATYLVGIGVLGSLLILPGLIVDGRRSE